MARFPKIFIWTYLASSGETQCVWLYKCKLDSTGIWKGPSRCVSENAVILETRYLIQTILSGKQGEFEGKDNGTLQNHLTAKKPEIKVSRFLKQHSSGDPIVRGLKTTLHYK